MFTDMLAAIVLALNMLYKQCNCVSFGMVLNVADSHSASINTCM